MSKQLESSIKNHVALVLDRSYSMLSQPVETVTDKVLARLREQSVAMNQETRVSIYMFNDEVKCVLFDTDVMRFKSIAGMWHPEGNTALIKATFTSVRDHQKLPQIYGDHAFLQYVITDGGENCQGNPNALQAMLRSLPDNWTMACLVPDSYAVHAAKMQGFSADSISVWNPYSKAGFEEVGEKIGRTLDNYMTARATGMRGTKSLFTLDSTALTKTKVTRKLDEVDPKTLIVIPTRRVKPKTQIRDFVESWTKETYRLGSAYYQLISTKPVEIQGYKNLLVRDKKNGRIYEGSDLRQMLNLPSATVKVNLKEHPDFEIFAQSTSVNRHVYPDTVVIVRK